MDSELEQGPSRGKFNPWVFIPVLYFMQAIPVSLVQDVAAIIYKDFGIANEPITRWTSLIALPWSLQMLLGPLVDLNFTKRKWILTMQMVIAAGLIIASFSLGTEGAFTFSLVVLGLTAVMSALCNIATDGFAILAMSKNQQARMAGFMSTFYRLGRLFCAALLVFIAGRLTTLPEFVIHGASLPFSRDGSVVDIENPALVISEGRLAHKDGGVLQPETKVPPGVFKMRLEPDGRLVATRLSGEETLGTIDVTGRTISSSPVQTRDPKSAWLLVFIVAVVVYALGHLVNRRVVPMPAADTEANRDPIETRRNIVRTLALLALGVGGYFLLNSIVRLTAHGIWAAFGSKPDGPQKGWMLPAANSIFGLSFGSPVMTELVQLGVCVFAILIGIGIAKTSIRGSNFETAISSFAKQQGFFAILFFIMFYRFGEAVIGKITPLFLKDSLDKGGLAIANDQLGVLSGLLGVVGIILGGITGGLVVSRIGLRRAFIPLVLAMHVPNILYLLASMGKLPMSYAEVPLLGNINLSLGSMLFVDQFGYGFGFAGYMVYLMWVAQRNKFETSHYAIGTGMGALCIATAGALSGVLQSNFGYTGTFWAVLFLSVPGLLALLLIPLDESHRAIKAELAD